MNSPNLARRIFLGMLVGAILGLVANYFAGGSAQLDWWDSNVVKPTGRLFIRIIFMIVLPLIVSAIVLGVKELGDMNQVGRVGVRCLLATLVFSAISVVIGLAVVNVIQPGKRLPAESRAALMAEYGGQTVTKAVETAKKETPVAERLLSLIPQNPLAEAVNAFTPGHEGGGLLSVMVFALFIGVAVNVAGPRAAPVANLCEAVMEVCMTVIGFAMKLAPLGVACLVFSATATLGLGIVKTLGLYLFAVLLALSLHCFGFYALALRMAGHSPLRFFRDSREALITGFTTSSSNATLPVSLRVAEMKLGIPKQISRFVLTVGATANQNGTALYEGVTVLFLAQVFGVELTTGQQITAALMCIVAGLGTAGAPGASLPMLVGVLIAVGVPGDSVAIIIGIDRILDMSRTAVNVMGDLVIARIVAGKVAPA